MTARPPYPGWVLVNRDSSPYHTSGVYRWVPPDDPAVTGERREGHVGILPHWDRDHEYLDHNDPRGKILPLPIRLAHNSTAPIRRIPEKHPKGWGHELWLADTPQYCGKLLCFNQGAKFSAHFHDLKNETFYVLKGKVKLTWFDLGNADEITEVLTEGEVIDIPRLCVHQVEALEESVIIEVSTQHLDSDSYRVRKGDSQK